MSRENDVILIINLFVKLLIQFDFGFEMYESGDLCFVDRFTQDKYRVKPEDFENAYKKIEEMEK